MINSGRNILGRAILLLAGLGCAASASSKATSSADTGPARLPLGAPLVCPDTTPSGPYVMQGGASNTQLVVGTSSTPLTLKGFTFYVDDRSPGGKSAWHDPTFPAYLDKVFLEAAQGGQNFLRPTDQGDSTDPSQTFDDPTVWSNMDYLVCKAAKLGLWVELDLSFYKKVLIAQGLDPYTASNWYALIDAVGQHYAGWPTLAFESFVGEPATPQTSADVQADVAFYSALLARAHAADPQRLLMPGGFIHMEDNASLGWWQAINSVPYASLFGIKIYSQNDMNSLPTWSAWAQNNQHVLVNQEFGMPQSQGDGTWSGATYNGLAEDRAQFFSDVYSNGQANGVQVFVFWNASCAVGSSDYDVSSLFPATWSVIQQNAPLSPAGGTPACP